MSIPPLRTRALNFAIAFAGHVADGMRVVSPEEVERRLSVCEMNECGVFQGDRCGSCGCPVNSEDVFLNKLAWNTSKCPKKLW